MKVSINEDCIHSLHYDINSELGKITVELLENLKHYTGESELTTDEVANQIGFIYQHLRSAIFNNFYSTQYAYLPFFDGSSESDELRLPPKYYKQFVEPKQRYESFSKIKANDSKLDSDAISFYKRATKNSFDLTDVFDNPTTRMNENAIVKSWMNRFLGTQDTLELDDAVNIYCQTDWMKSEKLEKMIIKVYSAFNFAKMLGSSSFFDERLKLIGKVIYEILFFIGNIFLSGSLADGKSEFIPLIFIATYFLKFYNPISILFRRKSVLENDNDIFLVKIHNKIMSDDYFHLAIIKEDFQELERKGLNISRYIFKLINQSKDSQH